MARIGKLLLVVGFCLGIYVPFLAMVSGKAPAPTGHEKRKPAPFPRLVWKKLATYPGELEAYVKDHFGFRDWLIGYNSLLRVRTLHISPVPNVVIGTDGWLFYAANKDGADLRDHVGKLPFTKPELEAARKNLEARRATCAAVGAAMLVVLAPNKQTVYPEKMSGYDHANRTRIDQFVEALAGSDVPVIDLRTAFAAHKNQADLYYRTDSHWNQEGAFVGYGAISAWLAKNVPGYVPLDRTAYRIVKTPRQGGDLAGMLSMAEAFPEEEVTFVRLAGEVEPAKSSPYTREYRVGAADLPRAILFGDSFAGNLERFLAPHFSRFVSHNMAAQSYDEALVRTEKPAVVILEIVERYLPGA
jgi:alginate O-acetyltransferase complex protein AlgJ